MYPQRSQDPGNNQKSSRTHPCHKNAVEYHHLIRNVNPRWSDDKKNPEQAKNSMERGRQANENRHQNHSEWAKTATNQKPTQSQHAYRQRPSVSLTSMSSPSDENSNYDLWYKISKIKCNKECTDCRRCGKIHYIGDVKSKPRWSRGSIPSSHARGQKLKPWS